jgi:hypothetical protein
VDLFERAFQLQFAAGFGISFRGESPTGASSGGAETNLRDADYMLM